MLSLPDGSIVPAIDVRAVRNHARFWSDKYYVRVELRDGSTRDVVEDASTDVAQDKQSEIIAGLREAMEEVEPYEYGYQIGFAEGEVKGRSEAFADGRSQGLQERWNNGHTVARQSILSAIYQQRETLMKEQATETVLPPTRRRYLLNAIAVLTNLIQDLFPDGQ